MVWAVRSGDWAQLEHEVRAGLAAQRGAGGGSAGPAPEDLRPRLTAWRRQRGLLSAEEYHAWLAQRGLSVDDVSEYLCRAWARERLAAAAAAAEPAAAPDPADVAQVAHEHAVISGRLAVWSRDLARRHAGARALRATGVEPRPPSAADVDELVAAGLSAPSSGLADTPEPTVRAWATGVLSLESAWRALTRSVADDERLARCLDGHRLDWQRLVWEEATFANEGAAREAALWVREEGVSLDAISSQAGVACTLGAGYGDEAGELGALLAATPAGELLGPLRTDEGWRLVCLRERRPPTQQDRELLARARDELLEGAVAPHLAGRVQFDGHI